jgi:hypothetical protein
MAAPNEDDVSYQWLRQIESVANCISGLRTAEEQDGRGYAEATTR